jgi:hypothetical protein
MPERAGWTRSGLLRVMTAAGAAAAGGALRADGDSFAAPSRATDAKILNFFLLLEYVQESFYREALERAGLTGPLADFARIAGGQETDHVVFLAKRLGDRARKRPRLAFGDAASSPERFRAAAIDLEETAIAAYIGQAANLTRAAVGPVGTLLSVEARQAAWVRDLAGTMPAPRAADAARGADAVLAHLREKGYLS